MSLAVLIPFRPDTPHRQRIYEVTSKAWTKTGAEVIFCDDGLAGLFSYAKAVNRARRHSTAQGLLSYSVDALPPSMQVLERVDKALSDGLPWTTVFAGQQRFTEGQTERLLAGADPADVGPATGEIAPGREAILGVRAEVWDDLRGQDERFVGWGPEDFAFHYVLKTLYPDGCDEPAEGLFQTLWHPPTSREAFPRLDRLWRKYQRQTNPAALRAWYLSR